jgi:hypothetical protein
MITMITVARHDAATQHHTLLAKSENVIRQHDAVRQSHWTDMHGILALLVSCNNDGLRSHDVVTWTRTPSALEMTLVWQDLSIAG